MVSPIPQVAAPAVPPQPDPVLFEAVSTLPAGLSGQGLRVVAVVVIAFSVLVGSLFAWLGAWPILGFTGAEAALVIFLLALHRRRSRRVMEMVQLAGGRLTIRRTDARGRPQEEVVLDPYWTRLSLEERPGRVSALLLRQRRRVVEVGALLGEEQKRDLAAAMADALRRYREPVFDNPQLRDPPP